MRSSQGKALSLIKHELESNGFSIIHPADHDFKNNASIARRFNSKATEELSNPYRPKIFKKEDLDKKQNEDLAGFNIFCMNMIKKIGSKENCLDAIFQTIDLPSSTHIAQAPHFDRIPTLKFMMYVNNLSSKTGAFCLSPGSHIWTRNQFGPRQERRTHGSDGFLEESRNIPASILSQLAPIEGKAGTIIIFDTDCIHHQGIVHAEQAYIIRSHYREKPPRWNLNSANLIGFLKNI